MDLDGKVAIVTGGAVRLGRAMVLALAGQGVKVCLHYGHSQAAAAQTLEEIQSSGGTASSVRADLLEPAAAARTIVDHALDQFGQADILVNSAAIFEDTNLADMTEVIWDRHFTINLKAPFFLCQAFVGQLHPVRPAHIVNVADWRALRPGIDHLAYTLTKSALVTLTHSLAQQLAPNVQVNAIAPGAILPPRDKDRKYLEQLAQRIPLQRTGDLTEVCDALLFLLRSDFITGEILRITGGEEL